MQFTEEDEIEFRFPDFDFDEEMEETREENIRVVMVEPGKYAREEVIGTDIYELQNAVGGGLIDACYPFEELVCIVCNDEGKINGMRPNRALRADDGRIYDVICGPFFICDCSTENFGSLTDEQVERYKEMFKDPEHFYMVDGEIIASRYTPRSEKEAR